MGAKVPNKTKSSSSVSSSHWKQHWESSPSSKRGSSRNQAVWLGRVLVLIVLVAVASILGFVAHLLLTNAEDRLAETQFESLTNRALTEAEQIAHRRRWAGVNMAATLSELYPRAQDWPQAPVLGFERIARAVLNTSSGVDMGMAPILTPEQAPAFEDFCYDVYEQLGFPNGTGYSSFGRGIWARNSSLGTGDNRYHDTGLEPSSYGSPYNVLTPIFRTDEGPHGVLMFNTHSMKFQGRATDSMITCANNRKEAYARGEPIAQESKCGVITDIFGIVKHNGRWGSALLRPVFPAQDPLELVALVSTLFLVDEILENVFSDEVSGIDAVFTSGDKTAVTFTIENGVAYLVGEGDHHDPNYDHARQMVEMLDRNLYTEDSPVYRLSLYPNANFSKTYKTNHPSSVVVGSVLIILLTSLVFLLYDFFVRRAFHAKKELMEARRQFMRFVSHEVRTPLNSVYMGLELMQEELAKAMGFESAMCALASHTKETGETDHHHSNKNAMPNQATISSQKALEWFYLTQEIQSNTQGATNILNDLLNYDKIEQGNLQITKEPISIWKLIERTAMEFKLAASSKKVQFEVLFFVHAESAVGGEQVLSASRDLPKHILRLKVVGDSVRLAQVIRNLISNALKFTPEGGTVRVMTYLVEDSVKQELQTLSIREDESIRASRLGSVRVMVKDTGAGMSPDQLDKLFSDGVQFNANELQAGEGSGLGLFIAKGIVRLHHGTLEAASDGLARGSTFSATLPLWELEKDEENAMNEVPTEEETSKESCNVVRTVQMRILVVDDAKTNRKLLRRLLENAGHTCDEAGNGKEAVEMSKLAADTKHPYHCVLMDYEMPIMDGPTAAKELRELGLDMSIVGITGNVLPHDIAHFKSCGADDVLSKPVKMAELDCLWAQRGTYERFAETGL